VGVAPGIGVDVDIFVCGRVAVEGIVLMDVGVAVALTGGEPHPAIRQRIQTKNGKADLQFLCCFLSIGYSPHIQIP
jgi:hypothetical protein